MATALVSNSSECCICFELFNTPKILPCGHTFCLCCIERLIVDETDTFPCPICQQDVKIPEGGAEEFTTNFQLTPKHTTQVRVQPPSTKHPNCPNHKQREVDYYCNNCNVGLCSKCIFKQHKDHETLDIECDETRNKTIEKLQSSQKNIQNRIKNLAKIRSTLLESFEQLKSLCEDSCAKVTEQTRQIVSELRKSCKQIIKDIRNNLEENRIKVEDREREITSEINVLESNMESIISPSTKTTLNILLTLPRLIDIENLGDSRIDYNLCIQYLQWVGKDFSLDIDQLGSVISKESFYIQGSYQFMFDVSDIKEYDIKKDRTVYYNKNKFRNHNLVWSFGLGRFGGDWNCYIKLLEDDNPKLNYCIIDGQISLLNIDNDSKTITFEDKRFESGGRRWWVSITWSELTDKNNGYFNSYGQFVIQLDITQIREISLK